MAYYTQSELLRLLVFAVVLAGKGYKAFGQTDETYAECAVIDYRLYGFFGTEFGGAVPQLGQSKRSQS